MAKKAKRYGLGGLVLAIVVAVGAAWLLPLGRGPKAEGAVSLADATSRVVSAGPVRLSPGMVADSRLLLPAVRGAMARVWVVDGDGNVLHVQDFSPQADPGTRPAFFDVFCDITLTDTEMVFGDGSVKTLIGRNDGGDQIIAILIGLLLPAVQKVQIPLMRAELGTMELRQLEPTTADAPSVYMTYTLENTLISGYS